MTQLSEYRDRYQHIRLDRDENGVLEVCVHTNGDSLVWGGPPHREFEDVFRDIAEDDGNRVVIFTGAGDRFSIAQEIDPAFWTNIDAATTEFIFRVARRLLHNFLAIQVPVIAALNGPAEIHAELPAVCDIVLASNTASFRDPHFVDGTVPADGVHIIWPQLIGINRAKYFLLTGQVLSAQEAMDLGVVAEILEPADLMPRARVLAAQLANSSTVVLRHTRLALSHVLQSTLEPALGYGLMLEVSAMLGGPPGSGAATR